jgi:RHS repeat-associated protein
VTVKEETFNYDAVGNRTADAVMTSYQHNAANRLLENSSYTYAYDLNGNQTGQTAKADNAHTTYVYNSENQLIGATMPDGTVASYKYDPLGRRIEKAVTPPAPLTPQTVRYVYDNEDIIAVLDGNNNVVSNFTHGPGIDEPLIMKSSANANYYYHTDGLGSITALTNETGAIVETIEYQAYGKPIIKDHTGAVFDSSTVGTPYLFTAREFDSESGLYYYRARYYSAEIGRFLQEDPIGFMGGENLYSYVDNRPVNNLDPFGLKKCKPFWGRVVDNFIRTNEILPGYFFPYFMPGWMGVSGATAEVTGTVTFMQWASLFGHGASVGAATFTSFETGVLVGVNAFYAGAFTAASFQSGLFIGSILNTMITPCIGDLDGNTCE